MKVLPPFERPACEVFVGGEWWPGVVDSWDRRPDGWWAFAWVTVTEVREVPRHGVMTVPLRYVQWFPPGAVRPANDENAAHPEG